MLVQEQYSKIWNAQEKRSTIKTHKGPWTAWPNSRFKRGLMKPRKQTVCFVFRALAFLKKCLAVYFLLIFSARCMDVMFSGPSTLLQCNITHTSYLYLLTKILSHITVVSRRCHLYGSKWWLWTKHIKVPSAFWLWINFSPCSCC